MKDITNKLITAFKHGYCTPQIARLAKKLKEPSTTLHYNIKKLEKHGAILEYKAVFNHKKIEQGYCSYILINLRKDDYTDPEKIAQKLASHEEIESVDIITGDWEMIVKIRTKDQDEYYELLKKIFAGKGIERVKTLTSLKQVKSEFMRL